MKRLLFFSGWWFFYVAVAFGQNNQVIRVKYDENPAKVTPFELKYRFDKFYIGTVSFFTGKSANARLNYNRLLGEMQFIDLKGDTLSLDEESTIKSILIGNTTFFYDTHSGFMEAVNRQPAITLAKKEILKPMSIEKLGAYNQSSSVSSINSYSSYTGRNGSYNKLETKEEYCPGYYNFLLSG